MRKRWSPPVLNGCLILILSSVAAVAQSAYPAARHGGNYMHNYYLPPAASSTPWAPAWSPDGESIAVSYRDSIWSVDRETGRARELTYNEKYHSLPDWSPDGRWIVYTADDGKQSIQLELLEVESGEIHRLTDDRHVYLDPVFSPDGTRLAYVSTKPDGHFNVFVRPIREGRWDGPETAVTRDNHFGRDRLYFGPWDMHITPDWLPGGQELLLVSNRDVPLGSGHVWRLPARENGFEKRQVVLREQTLYRTRPRVSLDGKRFVFSSSRGAADQYNNLYVQPPVGGEPYKLTFFQHDAFHPVWSPDGERIAYVSNEGGLPQLEVIETYGGRKRRILLREHEWKRPVGRIRVRVEAEGALAPARVHLTAADGKFYAPADAYARVSAAQDPVFHTLGAFEVEVPVGEVKLTVVKGFEFLPARISLPVAPGETTSAQVELRRNSDWRRKGYYSGSTHVHMNYAGNLHNSLENLLLMSAAEDQDIVNEQIANKDNRILDYQYFVPGGGPHPLSAADRILVVGQEYRPPFYGHVFMLGLRDHLISPFTTGYEETAIESLYPSNTDMLRKAKAQGATVGYVHSFGGNGDPLEGNLGGAKGYMVDAALGTTDAVEWSAASRAGFFPWYATLNNGLRVTAVGGEDSISDLHRSKLVGSVRTYVHTGDRGLDMEAWFDGLRAGRAFVSTAPLIDFRVEGKEPGDEVLLDGDGGEVEVSAEVVSIVPLQRAELVFNGRVTDTVEFEGDRKRLTWRRRVSLEESDWFHLRVEGSSEEKFPLDTVFPQAFTNPVWVRVGEQPVRDAESARYSLRWIDKLESMALEWPGWRSEREKEHVLAQFEEARQVYRRFEREAEN